MYKVDIYKMKRYHHVFILHYKWYTSVHCIVTIGLKYINDFVIWDVWATVSCLEGEINQEKYHQSLRTNALYLGEGSFREPR